MWNSQIWLKFSSWNQRIKNDFILDSGTKPILVLENNNTKYGRNVLTAKSKSILTILHWI